MSESKPWAAVVFVLLTLLVSRFIWAKEEAPDENDTLKLKKITVTGSRIKRTDLEGPTNVIVIDQAQLSERGYTTVYEALEDLTVNNGYKPATPEVSGRPSPDVQTINLRGFDVGTTLTLVNGRRLANYPAAYLGQTTVFNYGSIPVAAVERIEVLTTGASAIYGSDAVAGVVNIILRKDINETTVNLLYGTPTESKRTRDDVRMQLLNGKTFDRRSYTLTLEYNKRDPILGRDYNQYDNQQDDYPYGQGTYVASLGILDNFKSAFGIYPRLRDPVETTGQSSDAACSGTSSDTYAFWPGNGNFCTNTLDGAPSINFRDGKESISAYFNGTLEVGNSGTELFTDLLYYRASSKNFTNSAFIFADILDRNKPDTVGFGSNDWYHFQRSFTAAELGVDPSWKYHDRAYTAVVGARGTLAGVHDWEFLVDYSKYTQHAEKGSFKWREVIDNMLGTWLGKSFFGSDWWSGGTLGEDIRFGLGIPENQYGAAGQAVRDAVGMVTYDNDSDDLLASLTVSGDLFDMPAGPLSYAAVLEYEDTSIDYEPDDLLKQRPPTTDVNGNPIEGLTGSGWFGMTGYHGDGGRQRYSIGVELRVPVLGMLTVTGAARYDHYDSGSTSFGGNVTPSASFEFRPLKNLLIRGGYTESFRAPDMAQVFVRTGGYVGAIDYVNCLDLYVFHNGTNEGFDPKTCRPVTIFAQKVGSQDLSLAPLDAETGNSDWLGFSWNILDNLNLTVDYTEITLEQRVALQSIVSLLQDEYVCLVGDQPSTIACDQVPKQIIRAVDPITGAHFITDFYVTSVNRYKEEGSYFDVKLTYNLNTRVGDFTFHLDYDNVHKHTLQLQKGDAPINLRDDPMYNEWDFRSSALASLAWRYRDFQTTLTAIYRGGTRVARCGPAPGGCVGNVTGEDYLATGNYRVGSYTTYNWTARYNWTDSFMTRVRVQNLFDQAPPLDDTLLPLNPPWYNPFAYPGAGIGRYAALELQYTFH